jgi:hypothetical protein
MEYGWFFTHYKANVRYAAGAYIATLRCDGDHTSSVCYLTQGTSGSWENKEFA